MPVNVHNRPSESHQTLLCTVHESRAKLSKREAQRPCGRAGTWSI